MRATIPPGRYPDEQMAIDNRRGGGFAVDRALLSRSNTEHGTTVLFVTHNPALAQRCGRTIQVGDGQASG